MKSILAALGILLGLSFASDASAQFIWNQPATGTTATFSAATWIGGLPGTGGTTATVRFNNYNGLGAGAFTLTQDAASFTANSLSFNNFRTDAFTMALGANPFTLGGTSPFITQTGPGNATISGTGGVTLGANGTISGLSNGALTISSIISGTGFGLNINRTGLGAVVLSGANTYDGGTTLSAGVLQIGAAAGFGTGPVTINGGALRFSSAVTIANNFTANSNFVVAGGTGAVTAASTPTLTGVISGAGGLRFQSFSTTAGAILQGANTFVGPFSIEPAIPTVAASSPTVTLSGLSGSFASTAPITIRGNGTLALTNTTTASNSNRVPDTAPINLIGGRLSYTAVAGNAEILGNVTVTGAAGLSTTPATGSTPTLDFGTLTRVDNATIHLSTLSFGLINSATTGTITKFAGGVPTIAVGTGTGQEIGVVPFMTASSLTNPRALVTYDATNGLQSIPHDNATFVLAVTTPAALLTATNKNVFVADGTYALGGGSVILNSLTNNSSTGTVVYQNGTVTVGSGYVVNFDDTAWDAGATLNFGSTTGYLMGSWNQTFRSTSSITGSGGLVIGGLSAARPVNFENTTGNPFTGGLFINGPIAVGFRADNQLGAAGGNITLGGGQLSYNALANLTMTRNIKINDANGTLTFGISDTTNGTGSAHTATTNWTVSGVISGTGALLKEGTGILTLAGANTYSGGTVVTAGTLQFSADNNLGASGSKITLNGGTLQPTAALSLSRPIDINASSTISNANALTLSGAVTNIGALHGTAASTLTKTGAGVLTLTGASPLNSAAVAVTAGGLTLSGNGTLNAIPSLTLSAGTNFTIDNTGTYIADRFADGGLLNFAGAATASYIAPGTATTDPAERFGNIVSTVAGSVFSVTGGTAPTILRFGNLSNTAAFTFRGTDLGGTSANNTRIFIDSFTAPLSVIPNTFFANTPGTGTSTLAAGYDLTRGIIQFTPLPVSGTTIRNAAPTSTSLLADFTMTGNATAVTGTSIFGLTLDAGTTLTLSGGDAASGTNGNTPDGTLALSGGILTSQNGAKTITSATPQIVSFGASLGTVTTTSDLSFAANVTLAGTSGLNKTGAGILTLNGPYAVTGSLTVSAGTLTFTSGATAGVTTLSAATTTNLGGATTVTDLAGSGTLAAGANAITVTSANPTTFSGNFTSTSTLTKTGTGAFTFAPTNTPAITSTTIANGTLTLGSASGANAVFNGFSLGDGSINTAGILDLNGFSPTNVAVVATNGTSTSNRIVNTSATLSNFNVTAPADATFRASIGGNLVMTKTGAGNLTLTGIVQPPTTTTGKIIVNGGTVTVASVTPVGVGMSFEAGTGGTVSFGAFGDNGGAPFGAIDSTGGAINVTGGSGDLFVNRMTFTEGSLNFTGTANFWWHFIGTGAALTTNASANPVTFTGVTGGSRIQNDNTTLLPITVADGAAAIDLDANTMVFNVGTAGFNKLGAGTMRMVATTNSAAFTVNAGTLLLDVGGATSGATTVNTGGRFVLNGNTTATVTVNPGGRLEGAGNIVTTGTNVIAGTIAPGNSAGTLTFGSSTVATVVNLSGGRYAFEMATVGSSAALGTGGSSSALPHTNHDVINIFGTVNVTGMVIDVTALTGTGFNNTQTFSWLVLQSTGTLTGTPTLGTISGSDFASLGAGRFELAVVGNSIFLDFNPVPEPATVFGLSALGLGAVGLIRRRLRNRSTAVAA